MFTYGKVLCIATILLTLVMSVWVITVVVITFTKEPEPEIPSYEGINMDFVIQSQCLQARLSRCKSYSKALESQKIKTWITNNNLTQCAIVQMAEKQCQNTDTLLCLEGTCSLSQEEQSKADTSRV